MTHPIVLDPTFDPPPTADEMAVVLSMPTVASLREFWRPVMDVNPTLAEFESWARSARQAA